MSSQIEKYLASTPSLTGMVVCYLIKGDKVILGLRKQVSWGLGENLISGIGGKIGDIPGLENETPDQALEREVQEEIGVNIIEYKKVADITFLFPNKPKWNQQVAAYIVTEWKGELQETEVIKPLEFEISALPQEQMWDDNQYWVPLILKGQKITATFLYGEDNKTVAEKQIK